MKKNIAIIMGGYSSEHGISIKSGNVVYKYLDRDKYHPYRVVITREKWFYLDENNREFPMEKSDFSLNIDGNKIHFDCVFNAIHGTPGEDGLMQAYFELLGIRHTSCNHYEAALTFNKRDLLSTLKSYGVPCAQSYFLNKGQDVDEDAIVEKVGLPCFVKANRAGSSYGVSKVYQKEELGNAIENAFKEDTQIIIESFLDGTEVSVGVITYENKVTVLPATEIISENDFFDFEAKYLGKSKEITPARISEKQESNVRQLAEFIYKTLGLKGYTRSEFIFIGDVPHLLEINTTPGLTEESLLPQQARTAGISLEDLFDSAIVEALR
ncbi:MAG: D-alanine--D-alanine ligase [Muricauda sp.]|jgi:D-alanine-D-alanine ligase|nr:D-alanine--D-alanine ligase [Allomuricauda sp.]MBO6533854.1 D-alanine--D-alanine ligase [Allomuricauda sp.]MBO6589383.1 D-alanine--D-alanine ligase [Allomuricauda sp.]MBO6619185.1 D-alanine--D-alanine ligase [Allomuricauda sp.]MBO6644920.1 D-alanine--D-alanine ligase [Allomuricauda sp.]MBO6747305.1 D-alanine--D-alanine ligase [Allomuricauda sp.]